MLTKKLWVYGVRVGRKTGILENWKEYQTAVHKYSGAQGKKFRDREEAYKYLRSYEVPEYVIYTDGSYLIKEKIIAGYGVVHPNNSCRNVALPLCKVGGPNRATGPNLQQYTMHFNSFISIPPAK